MLTFAVATGGAYALTQRLDPSGTTAVRNSRIASGLAIVGGLALSATKSPLLGAGIAAGGLVALGGSTLGSKLASLLQKPLVAPIGAVYGQMGAVYGQMGDYQPMGAYEQMGAYQQMGAVYGQMGDAFTPAAPWVGNPF